MPGADHQRRTFAELRRNRRAPGGAIRGVHRGPAGPGRDPAAADRLRRGRRRLPVRARDHHSGRDLGGGQGGWPPKPGNVLVRGSQFTVAALAELGVRRISVGGALARAAWSGFMAAATETASDGTFRWVDAATARVNGLLARR